jgi:hypothetical protein
MVKWGYQLFQEAIMAFSDLYEVRVEQEVRDQQVVNVFHVLRTAGTFDASDVVAAFNTTILYIWQLCCHTSLEFVRIYAFNLDNPTDFSEEYYVDKVGQRSGGEAYAPFVAVGMRFPRLRLDMRHGYKRFAGLSEADVTGGEISGTLLGLFNNLGLVLVGTWHDDVPNDICNFVIVKRVKILTIDPPGVTYRMPEDDLEFVYYQPQERVVSSALTSQNTRKIGRGA